VKLKDLWNKVLALFRKKHSPADPYKEAIAIMSQISDLVGRLDSALTRIAADKTAAAEAAQADQNVIAKLTADNADLTQQLADAETQLVTELAPVVDKAEAISPPPAA
jgi:hypothetical protein